MKNHNPYESVSPVPAEKTEKKELKYDDKEKVNFYHEVAEKLANDLFYVAVKEYKVEGEDAQRKALNIAERSIGAMGILLKENEDDSISKVNEWMKELQESSIQNVRYAHVKGILLNEELLSNFRFRMDEEGFQKDVDSGEVVEENNNVIAPGVSDAVRNRLQAVDAGVEKTRVREADAEQGKRDIEFFESVRGELSEYLVAHLMDEYEITNKRAAKLSVQSFMMRNFGRPDSVAEEVSTIKKSMRVDDLGNDNKDVFMLRFFGKHADEIARLAGLKKKDNNDNGAMKEVV